MGYWLESYSNREALSLKKYCPVTIRSSFCKKITMFLSMGVVWLTGVDLTGLMGSFEQVLSLFWA